LTSVTVSAWVKVLTGGMIFSNHTHGVFWESVELSNQNFIINSGNDMGTRQSLPFTPIADSLWHHIAAVWDGSEMRIYVDGFPYGDSLAALNAPWNSSAKVTIGARESFVTPPSVGELKGNIEELRVWNVARSQIQIQRTMNKTLEPEYYNSSDSGLIVYYRFDELEDLGIGGDGADDIRDFSVSQLHGDLTGDASLDTSINLTSIKTDQNSIPIGFSLEQNYPNPFNPSTTIEFSIPHTDFVTLKIYNLLGEEVASLVSERLTAGKYKYDWNAEELPSGVYFYKLNSGTFTQTKKMFLLR
jgi:hypothetical protein